MRRLCVFLLLVFAFVRLQAQPEDSLRVSVLTCTPGDQVYSLYGHTALRVENFTRDFDLVFNYGVFDFTKPHFTWHFVLGECDYMVMPLPWDIFVKDYVRRGSGIYAQILDLTPAEANRLQAFLIVNCQPENREYRYNFLYNNCTTKVRDVIEQVVNGEIDYPALAHGETYRQLLHQLTKNYPWSQEGNDFLLGADVDKPLSDRESMFLPLHLMSYLDGATLRDENGVRSLVGKKEILLQEVAVARRPSRWHSPKGLAWAFFLVNLLILLVERSLRRKWWIYDVVLLTLQGLAGCLLAFMFFFSEHPAVGSNWLVWVFNPLPLFGAFCVARAALKGGISRWHAFNFAVLTFFILISPLLSQKFGQIVVPLTLVLWLRPLSYLLSGKRRKISPLRSKV